MAHDRLDAVSGRSENTLPIVTVIMPVRNEEKYIANALNSVLHQDYPSDKVQILIVDGMSDDRTRELALDMIEDRRNRQIEILDNPERIVPTALNRGLAHAAGDIIIRVDGHCEIAPNYVRRCVDVLSQIGADCAGGVIMTVGETKLARAIAQAQSSSFGVGDASFRIGASKGRFVDTLAFGAYRRSVFDHLGGFDEELTRNQDDEFNFRLIQQGGKIWLDPSISTVYYSRTSLRKLWRQYFQYGFYKVRVIQKRGAVPSWRHVVPAALVIAVALAAAMTIITGSSVPALLVLGPYLAANLTASILAAGKEAGFLLLLPIVFAILHVGYGAGFLAGLWHWRKTWHEDANHQPAILEKAKVR